jgi:hypothetical protein
MQKEQNVKNRHEIVFSALAHSQMTGYAGKLRSSHKSSAFFLILVFSVFVEVSLTGSKVDQVDFVIVVNCKITWFNISMN